jgi:LCP family protein required for cell wall assembly
VQRWKNISTLKKIILGIISLILILLVTSSTYIYTTLNKINTVKLDTSNLEINPNFVNEVNAKEIRNIAILGIDSMDGEIGRSDSILILTIDQNHNKLKISSIIRDSYVEIPGRDGKDKINHAYAFGSVDGTENGGPTLAIKTLNKNFNLNIHDFISVNFSSLPKLIDSIGGIDVNITDEELKFINNSSTSNLSSSGIQKLDGAETLAYSRIRYTSGGDFERSHRHRTVLTALFNKLKSTSSTSYPDFLNELLPLINTNLTSTDIISLAMKMNSLSSQELGQDRFPRDNFGKGQMINGVYYYVFDIEETAKQINDYIFLDK